MLGLSAGLACALALAASLGGCHGSQEATDADGGTEVEPGSSAEAAASAPGTAAAAPAGPVLSEAEASGKPLLAVTGFVATVFKEPRDTSKKLGYLRAGSKVIRSDEPVGKAGCKHGWYAIQPRGYVCANDDATTDMDHPILKAVKRADTTKPLPFHYAFVRAVLPLYMRVPTKDEQFKSEFKLQEHLDWFQQNQRDVSKVSLGANDVPIDARGVALPDKKVGELGLEKNSTELSLGALLGGQGDDDAPPFWLEGGKRSVGNISDYKVKGFEVFADRARRHAGLSLIGSFAAGPESLERRFAITTDLRLAPASKIKPDAGSPWHGVELNDNFTLPIGFVRSQGAHTYRLVKGKVVAGDAVDFRQAVALAGTQKTVGGTKYYRMRDKRWISAQDVGLAVAPATWPEDAEKGKKWIEISITNQTFVLWEGKKPVYATLVSTGKDGLDDPKKTAATVRGTFKIRNKHVSATMDSNERSSVGGAPNTKAVAARAPADDDDDAPKKKRRSKGEAKTASKGKKDKGSANAKAGSDNAPSDHDKPTPHKGDGEYGVTKRRGEGTFLLRDVPWIQYFESGYAIHAAYWHDVFGTPRSHGCVNLSPVDAHRVFYWTDPPLPDGWHGVNSSELMGDGTTVIIHE